eukprot:2414003-Alexandrium_andersonii.AAC.1
MPTVAAGLTAVARGCSTHAVGNVAADSIHLVCNQRSGLGKVIHRRGPRSPTLGAAAGQSVAA